MGHPSPPQLPPHHPPPLHPPPLTPVGATIVTPVGEFHETHVRPGTHNETLVTHGSHRETHVTHVTPRGPVHETTRVHDIVRETILPPQPLGRPPLLVPRPVLSSAMLGDRGGPTHWVDPRRSLYLESLSLARPKH